MSKETFLRIHSPECSQHNIACCPGLLSAHPHRTVKLSIFAFDQLSPAAQKIAVINERAVMLPQVQLMVEQYAAQQFPTADIAYVEYPYREVAEAFNNSSPNYYAKASIAMGNPPFDVQKVRDVCLTIESEILQSLADEKMIAHIKADNLQFLADGTIWLYADKEGA